MKILLLLPFLAICLVSHSQKRILIKDHNGATHSIGGICTSICGNPQDSLAEREETYLEITPEDITYYRVIRKVESTNPITFAYDFVSQSYVMAKLARKDLIKKKLTITQDYYCSNENRYGNVLELWTSKDKVQRANHDARPQLTNFINIYFDSYQKAEEVLRMLKGK